MKIIYALLSLLLIQVLILKLIGANLTGFAYYFIDVVSVILVIMTGVILTSKYFDNFAEAVKTGKNSFRGMK